MPEYSGQLGLGAGFLNKSGMHTYVTTHKRKGINFVIAYPEKVKGVFHATAVAN